MPASTRHSRPSSLHTEAGRPRSSHTGHQSPGLLEVEAQQAEHQANQVNLHDLNLLSGDTYGALAVLCSLPAHANSTDMLHSRLFIILICVYQ